MTTEERPKHRIDRRSVFRLAGTAAAAGIAAGAVTFAQAAGEPAQPAIAAPGKSMVVLDRLPGGVLMIGIDRPEAQNRVDIPTFGALGQA